jgi:hypothetical protein
MGMSGFPEHAFDDRVEQAELAPYVGSGALAYYEACTDKVACRNMIIDARLRAVDLAFYRFMRKVYRQQTGVSLGSDMVALGLDSVAAVTGTRALAAGAGAVTGGRDAYKQQVVSASTPLLFEEMIANRLELLLRIRHAQSMPVSAYSLFQGLSDVSEYELAGSIPHAASTLAASAGGAARTAQARLDAQREAAFAASSSAASAAPVPAAPSLPTSAPSLPTSAAALPAAPAVAPALAPPATAAPAPSP